MKDVKFEKKLNAIDIILTLENTTKINGFFSDSGKKIKDNSQASQDVCIKSVLFDTLGTVVDWRGTMVKEFDLLFDQKGIRNVTGEEFVEIWVTAYSENMQKISEGKKIFATVDELNKIALINTLKKYNIYHELTEVERDEMWMVWHRLEPWPDSVSGINRIKEQCTTGILSNGNIRLLEDLSKKAKLEWDIILSGELFRCYKPDPLVYQSAARVLKLKPSEILLVASHKYDLEAAKECGYKTAYIFRPSEFKTLQEGQIPRDNEFDFVTEGIDDLAEQLRMNIFEPEERSVPFEFLY